MKQFILLLSSLLIASLSHADYNADAFGKITHVKVVDTSVVYFKLDTQPKHSHCNTSMFVIPFETSIAVKNMLLDRLMESYRNNEAVMIGYDAGNNCSKEGFIKMHAIGTKDQDAAKVAPK